MAEGERIPILKVGGFLLATIQVDVHDRIALGLKEDLVHRVADTGATGVILDVSGLDIVDSFTARVFADIAAATKLLGAETVVAGIRPAVALTLVELGVTFEGVNAAADLDHALELLNAQWDRKPD